MQANLDELERIAKAASRGPWHADGCIVEGRRMMIYDEGGHTAEDAAHIAAFNPQAALALLAELREARAALEAIRVDPTDRPLSKS